MLFLTETLSGIRGVAPYDQVVCDHRRRGILHDDRVGRRQGQDHTPKITACSVSRPRQTLVASLSRVIGRTVRHAVARAITVAFSGEKQVHTLCNEHFHQSLLRLLLLRFTKLDCLNAGREREARYCLRHVLHVRRKHDKHQHLGVPTEAVCVRAYVRV